MRTTFLDPELVTSITIIIISALIPAIQNTWLTSAFLFFMLLTIMGHSWNLFSGLTRIISFGHGAFFGLGAYATFIVVRDLSQPFPFSFILSLIMASAICGSAAFLLSYPFLALRGLSFAICTLAFTEFLAIVFANTQIIERGHEVAFIQPQTDIIANYYLTLLILFLVTMVFWRVKHSKLGLALIAIGENEAAAESLGVDVFSSIRSSYVISAICMGLVGALYPYILLSATVETLFGIERSLIPLVVGLLGGPGSIAGSFMGALVFQILAEALRTTLGYLHLVVLGSLVILIHLLEPSGIFGIVSKLVKKTK